MKRTEIVIAEAASCMGGVPGPVLAQIETWYQALCPRFVAWFVGFYEGDGGLIFKDSSGIRRATDVVMAFTVTQSTWNVEVLHYIRDQLGFGHVVSHSEENMIHRYYVRDQNNLLKILYLLIGKLQLDKRKAQFASFLVGFNSHWGYNITDVLSQNLLTTEHSWVTGFTEAEGCFTVTVQAPTEARVAKAEKGLENKKVKAEEALRKAEAALARAEVALANNEKRAKGASPQNKPKAEAALEISRARYNSALEEKRGAEQDVANVGAQDQAHVNHQVFVRYVVTQVGEPRVMRELAALFSGRVSGKNMTVNLQSLRRIEEYLALHPMRGKKQEAYEVWRGILAMVLAKEHLTGGLESIKTRVAELNRLNGNKAELAGAEMAAGLED